MVMMIMTRLPVLLIRRVPATLSTPTAAALRTVSIPNTA